MENCLQAVPSNLPLTNGMAKSVTDQAKHNGIACVTYELEGAADRLHYCISKSRQGMQGAQGIMLQKSNMQGAINTAAMEW